MTEAYPLQWPEGKARLPQYERERSRFKTTLAEARDALLNEIYLLGATNNVISTDIELRRDGLPYASKKPPQDPAVAVYFTYKNKQHCFACDRWDRVKDNVQAIRHTIGALRGIERWGTGDMLEAALTGYLALPAPTPWHQVLGVSSDAPPYTVKGAYRRLARTAHPDSGGSDKAMSELTSAMAQWKATQGIR